MKMKKSSSVISKILALCLAMVLSLAMGCLLYTSAEAHIGKRRTASLRGGVFPLEFGEPFQQAEADGKIIHVSEKSASVFFEERRCFYEVQ